MKHLIPAAFFCGLALGTKYNALIVLLLLSLFIPFCYLRLSREQRQSQFKAIGYFFIFISVSLVVFSPWMVRNYRWTKNPLYPLYGSWFDKITSPQSLPLSADQPSDGETIDDHSGGGWNHFTTRKYVYRETVGEIISIPLRIFFQGRDDDPKYFDGKLNPFLLLLPLLSLFNLKQDPDSFRIEKIFLTVFCILYLLIAFLQTDMRIRYITPIIPPLVILSVSGLQKLFSTKGSREKRTGQAYYTAAGIVVLVAMLGLNASYLYEQFRVVDPLPYIGGKIGRDDYITRYRPEFPSIRYINSHLSDNSRILGVFLGNRGYYFDKTVIFDFSFMKKSVKKTSQEKSLREAFCRRRISHIMLRRDLFDSWVKQTFSQNEIAVLNSFFRHHTRLLFSKAGYDVYVVIDCMPTQKAMDQHVS